MVLTFKFDHQFCRGARRRNLCQGSRDKGDDGSSWGDTVSWE